MKLPFQKRNEEEISVETAEQLLHSVFISSHHTPHTIPLATLMSYSNYRKERFSLQHILLILIMILFLLLPLLFIHAKLDITEQLPEAGNPSYTIHVSSLIPLQKITATNNGRSLPVYQTGPEEYRVQPFDNGDLSVSVTLVNKQISEWQVDVTNTDFAKPVILSSATDDSFVYLYAADDGSGIDYSSIRIMDENGVESSPVRCDPNNGEIVIAYPSSPVDIFIPDLTGNELHLLLTPGS